METQETIIPYAKRNKHWSRYNLAKTKEKFFFYHLLSELCSTIPEPAWCENGRPPIPIRDLVFSACIKLYLGCGGRKLSAFLVDACNANWISKTPHFNSLHEFMRKEELTQLLQRLLTISAMPLRELETTVAIDSSGFSTRFYTGEWRRNFINKVPTPEEDQLKRGFFKAHLVIGVASKIIISCEITDSFAADIKSAPKLLEAVADHFNAKEVVADKAYSSKRLFQLIDAMGAVPYILFKPNSNPDPKTCPEVWLRMFRYFKNHHEQFLAHYHQRSSVESCFSAIKNKLGERLRARNPVGQKNELLIKFIVHNLCVLSYELLGTDMHADFGKLLLSYIDEEGKFTKRMTKIQELKSDLGV